MFPLHSAATSTVSFVSCITIAYLHICLLSNILIPRVPWKQRLYLVHLYLQLLQDVCTWLMPHISRLGEWGDQNKFLMSSWLKGCKFSSVQISSVQFSHSVVFDSLRPSGLQQARLPCPSPIPRVYSNSCSLSWWYHPTISSFVIPFSSCLQSFPASGSFPMSQLFASGGQSIGVSASASVLPMNIQDEFPLGWTCWISLQSKGLSRVFSNTTVQKHQFFSTQLSL